MRRIATAAVSAVSLLVAGCATHGTTNYSLSEWCEENPWLCVAGGVLIVGGGIALIVAANDDDNDTVHSPPPSDSRLKQDVRAVGQAPNGLPIYTWTYLGSLDRFAGVMAEDVLQRPDLAHAVATTPDGLLLVDYEALGLTVVNQSMMREAGEQAIVIYRDAQEG